MTIYHVICKPWNRELMDSGKYFTSMQKAIDYTKDWLTEDYKKQALIFDAGDYILHDDYIELEYSISTYYTKGGMVKMKIIEMLEVEEWIDKEFASFKGMVLNDLNYSFSQDTIKDMIKMVENAENIEEIKVCVYQIFREIEGMKAMLHYYFSENGIEFPEPLKMVKGDLS